MAKQELLFPFPPTSFIEVKTMFPTSKKLKLIEVLNVVNRFKYPGSVITIDGRLGEKLTRLELARYFNRSVMRVWNRNVLREADIGTHVALNGKDVHRGKEVQGKTKKMKGKM